MYAKIHSAVVHGIDGLCIEIEASISKGLPSYQIVGLPDKTIRESKERIRNAIENLGMKFPPKRVTLNLIPAEVPKDGSHLDLPMAISILVAIGEIPPDAVEGIAFFGEMTLDGRLMGVPGILTMVHALKSKSIRFIVLPANMIAEACMEKDVKCFGADSLSEVVERLKSQGHKSAFRARRPIMNGMEDRAVATDFKDVLGQELAKRALVISASGFHNILISGPPGSGKTMMMRAFEYILPLMDWDEAVEVRRIHSVSHNNSKSESGLSLYRPFRKPHHQVTPVAMIGGGVKPKPGELTLAHKGVLFLDELPEFKRDVIEALRQPLEDNCVSMSRLHSKLEMPAHILLAATMNPCKCGYLFSLDKVCTCSEREVKGYLGRLSGPMIDRIDLLIEVQKADIDDFGSGVLTTREMGEMVGKAFSIQQKRFEGDTIRFNSQMKAHHIKRYCILRGEAKQLFLSSVKAFNFSKRVQDKILRISRTIADVEGVDFIELHHIAESIQYRMAEKRLRGGS